MEPESQLSAALSFTQTHRWKITTQMCVCVFFFCLFTRCKVHLSFTCFDKLRKEEECDIWSNTHTYARWCWAGSVTAGSRLEWHSIPPTARGAVYTDKTLLYAHILHTCIIHSRHHELKEQQIQHTPNKTSITGTAEASVRWAAVGARVFHFLNKQACCFAEDF